MVRYKLKTKYKNRKVVVNGHSFDSIGESKLYLDLKTQAQAGLIEILGLQDCVRMTPAKILFKPDFKCRDLNTGTVFWVEFKGYETPVYNIKKRLWKHFGPGPLLIFKQKGNRIVFIETINNVSNCSQKGCSTCVV